jgi:hypothetical protein
MKMMMMVVRIGSCLFINADVTYGKEMRGEGMVIK